MATDGIARKAEPLALVEVGAEDARREFGELLNRVGFGGERVMVTRHGKPVAGIVSVEDMKRLMGEAA
jgi:prevent-host-death family protein